MANDRISLTLAVDEEGQHSESPRNSPTYAINNIDSGRGTESIPHASEETFTEGNSTTELTDRQSTIPYRDNVSEMAFQHAEGYQSDLSIGQPGHSMAGSQSKKGLLSGPKGQAIVILGAILLFLVGLFIGVAIRSRPRCPPPVGPWSEYNSTLSRILQGLVSQAFLKDQLELISGDMHRAGTSGGQKLAEQLASDWRSWGWPKVLLDNYTVALSEADPDRPNEVALIKGTTVTHSLLTSTQVLNQTMLYYQAASPSGKAEGEFVYVGFCRPSDFAALVSLNVSACNGRILIGRLGRGFRGGKAEAAAKHCARRREGPPGGLLLYPDPEDFARGPTVYPDSWWLPGDAPIFGNARMGGGGGDLTTPGLPSIEGIYRESTANSSFIPTFPIQPIGYDDALVLFKYLGGPPAPPQFGNESARRRVGPSANYTIRMAVYNRVTERPIVNVIGILPGDEEPDRYVLLGNHRDAWVFGANDPGSGTVLLQQTARLLGEAYQKMGYRPRRTLILCSWDSEEMGLIGSTEFTERLSSELKARSVAYVNIDSPVKGDWSFRLRADSLLAGVGKASARSVWLNESTGTTLFDDWSNKSFNSINGVSALGGGSDHIPFNYKLGIPGAYPEYTYKQQLPSMPAYHTVYDSIDMMLRFIDPNMTHHAVIGRFLVDFLLRLTDEAVIPYSLNEFTELLQHSYTTLLAKANKYKPFQNEEISLDAVNDGILELSKSALSFTNKTAAINSSVSAIDLRVVNNILLQFPRAFLSSDGLPSRAYYKNILVSPSLVNSYVGSMFTGVDDALILASRSGDWAIVKRQISVLVTCLHQANQLLKGGLTGLAV